MAPIGNVGPLRRQWPFQAAAATALRSYMKAYDVQTVRRIHGIVPNRRVIAASGRDTVRLLQNLTTNDVTKMDKMQFTAVLTPQGRTIGMAFLYKAPQQETEQDPASSSSTTIWIDVDEHAAGAVLDAIKRFKLRSKVNLTDQTDNFAVLAHWDGDRPFEDKTDTLADGQDTRAPDMGFRSIVQKSGDAFKRLSSDSAAASSSTSYTIHRMCKGVADTSEETAGGMPLEANLDLMHGVDFRKGCYIGQELTARTHHTGIIRKRIVPVMIYDDLSSPPDTLQQGKIEAAEGGGAAERAYETIASGTDVRSEPISRGGGGEAGQSTRGRSAGKLLSHVGSVGLAMLRLEQVHRWNKDFLMRVAMTTNDAADGNKSSVKYVRPFIPTWWPEDVQQQQQS